MSSYPKKIFSLLLLMPPLLLTLTLSFLPHEILKWTAHYTKPVIVKRIFAIRNVREITDSQESKEEGYRVTLLNGDKIVIKCDHKKEGLNKIRINRYRLLIITNRPLKDENEKKYFSRILRGYEDTVNDLRICSKREYLASANDINFIILLGCMDRVGHIISGVLFTAVLFLSLALYIPITERVVKVWAQNRYPGE